MKNLEKITEKVISLFFTIFFKFRKPIQNKILYKTINLYRGSGFSEIFSQIRAWDAPFEDIDKLIPKKAEILDLGSGDGLLSNYLALSSNKRNVVGIEMNEKRVLISPKGLKNVKFKQGNILTHKLPKTDVYILAHVLHHLPSKIHQEKLLKKIAGVMQKKQKLLILEIDNKPKLKYITTWLTDAFIVPILFEQKIFNKNFYYRNRKEWYNLLDQLGFKIRIKKVHKGMPFSHVLIEAIKE